MDFDRKVKKILKELYPNDYNFDPDKDKDKGDGNDPFDVFDQMMQIVRVFQTYNNIEPASQVEQKLKELYNQWSGDVQNAVVRELMNMAMQDNPNWTYVADTILSVIVPSADDEKDSSPMGATVHHYSPKDDEQLSAWDQTDPSGSGSPMNIALQLVKEYSKLRTINIKDAEGTVRLRWREINQALKDGVIKALVDYSKAGNEGVGLFSKEILTIILNEDV